MSSDLERIKQALARTRQRIREMESGQRGVIPAEHMHMNAGAAFDNQLRNLYTTQARLETDLVQAMLGRGWGADEIIRRMEMRLPESS